jgi:general secretion pathway protein D
MAPIACAAALAAVSGMAFAQVQQAAPGTAPSAESARRILIDLSLDGADPASAANAVLGQALRRSFTIDPAANAEITLRLRGRLTEAEILTRFEAALAAHDIVLIEREGGFFITQRARARQAAGPARVLARADASELRSGYQIVVVPLQRTAPAQVTRVLEPTAPQGAIVGVDEARGAIVLAGSHSELRTLIETIAALDQASAGEGTAELKVLRNAAADAVAEELRQILAAFHGAPATIVPIRRLNALLIIAHSQEEFARIQQWIERLDIETSDGGDFLHQYRPVHVSAEHLAETLGRLLGEGGGAGDQGGARNSRISADPRSNTLFVRGTRQEYAAIERVLRSVDVPPEQILIEATIVEVTLNNELRFGVNWDWLFSNGDKLTLSDATSGAVAQRFPGLSYVFIDGDVRAVLNAVSSRANVQVVSSPRVLALDNHEATLRVGDQVPIVVQSSQSPQTPDAPIISTTEYRDTGVILKVTPRLSGESIIMLEVSQEVSEVARTTTSGIDSPTIQQRTFESTVAVADGKTVAFGGLISSNRSNGSAGVPLLSRIPGLGALFGNKNTTGRRTELIVFLTPRIVHASDAAETTGAAMRQGATEIERRQLGPGVPPPEENEDESP